MADNFRQDAVLSESSSVLESGSERDSLDTDIPNEPPPGDNYFLIHAEIEFSDGLLPSKGGLRDPLLYNFEGLTVKTTFKGEKKDNMAIVREGDGHFLFGTRIETIEPVHEEDTVEEILFLKEGYKPVVFKNIKLEDHLAWCDTVIIEPCIEGEET